jgi:subtilisin family serine protease
MPVHSRMRAQVNLILEHLEGSAAYPPPEQWDGVDDVLYLYRRNTVLVRERDAGRVARRLMQIFGAEGEERPEGEQRPEGEERPFEPYRVFGEVFRILVPDGPPLLPDVFDALDDTFGPGVATPENVLYVTGFPCPATEPIPVPGTWDPVPPPGVNRRCRHHRHNPGPGCDGDGVSISIVDTGLIPDVAAAHRWLAGAAGTEENPYNADGTIGPYAGHGTFVAGVARCVAPKVSVFVERAYGIDTAGAIFETDLAPKLEDALDRNPDILVFTFATTSRADQSLLTFDQVLKRRIRHLKVPLLLAPAGNSGERRLNYPAAYSDVISVGALAANWRGRATFSNYGPWVDVYGPGEDLINAYPSGTYVCNEPPIGEHREFDGMAKWSGTSFSTPVVAGMIAARMSATGENARQAADSLLRLACGQAIPGVGAVLYPGQACCAGDHCHQDCGQEGCRCGKR